MRSKALLPSGHIRFDAYDKAVHQSFLDGLVLERYHGDPGKWSVASRHDPTRHYITTERYCSCLGHTHTGFCVHRARVIFEMDRHWHYVRYPDGTPPAPF